MTKTKRRLGRPPSDNPLSVLIGVRLTPEQSSAFQWAAEKAGKKLGPWLRDLGLKESARLMRKNGKG